MKRIICMILCCLMIMSSLSACAPAAPVQQDEPGAAPVTEPETPVASEAPEEEKMLPAVGDEFSGFVVKKIIPMEMLGSTGVLFEHSKSGATLLYLANKDINRAFQIAFKTPALDDKGKPHVFEHMTICGSQKYPDANLFFPVINRTYSTFVNAFTYGGMTVYPVASLSEDQLMRMMDYYLSGVFEPLLYTEPRLVEREAWRYELPDADGAINIAGTVYSEMQGALTLDARAMYNTPKTLYKDSLTAHVSGGIPEDIRTLSYDELVTFHDTYYHPSNALITLYGDLDYEKILEYIDKEYLSKYEKKDIYIERGVIEPFTKTEYATFEAPVEAGANTENASVISYAFALNGASEEDYFAMEMLSGVLSQESSLLMQALREKLPEASVNIFTDFDCPSAPYLSISVSGIDEEDREVLVSAVDEALGKMAVEGVSGDALDSVLAVRKMQLMATPEDTDLGVNAGMVISLGWVYFDNVEYYTNFENVVSSMTLERANELLNKYLVSNAHRAVVLTKPAAGLTEKNADALARELADKKAAMSKEEVQTMAQEAKEFAQWSSAPVSEEIIGQIADVDVANLPEELQHFDVKEETDGGVRYMSAEAEVGDIFSGTLLLDGSTIPVDKLQDVQLYLQLLGNLDTAKHSMEELSTLLPRYLNGMGASLYSAKPYDDASELYSIRMSWIGLGEDVKQSMSLLKEIVYETDLSDIETIKSILNRYSTDFRQAVEEPLSIQLGRCNAMMNNADAYAEYVSNYAFYDYMQNMIELAETDPAQLQARLESAREIVNNKNGAIVMCAGNGKAISAYREELPALFADMSDEEREKVDYSSLRLPRQNEALVNNSTVQMNLLIDAANSYSGKDIVINNMISDRYMTPQLRNALGAYGAYATGSKFMNVLYTYRDPNLAGSFDIFAKLPEYLRATEFTQEDVDSYIIGSYSSLSRPEGALSGASEAMERKLMGLSDEMRLQWQKDAKATTPEDVKAAAEIFEALVQNGIKSSSGTAAHLEQGGDLFDELIRMEETDEEAELQNAA